MKSPKTIFMASIITLLGATTLHAMESNDRTTPSSQSNNEKQNAAMYEKMRTTIASLQADIEKLDTLLSAFTSIDSPKDLEKLRTYYPTEFKVLSDHLRSIPQTREMVQSATAQLKKRLKDQKLEEEMWYEVFQSANSTH